MPQELIIPFTWESWYMQDNTLCNTYYQVTFTKDFGIIKKGECFDIIFVNYGKGIVTTYNINDGVDKTQKFIAQPINE